MNGRRSALPVIVVLAVLAGASAPAAGPSPAAAAQRIVVHGRMASFHGKTVTYRSSQGRFSATWIGRRHYRVGGTIAGKRLSGTFRTRQVRGNRYAASGSGRLGGRAIRIGGGGPNTLKTATLILS